MRTKEQFKEYVYAKAAEKRSANKRSYLTWTRGIAAFSLLFIISGVLIYGNFTNRSKARNAETQTYGVNNANEFYFFSKNEAVEDCAEAETIKCYSALTDSSQSTVVLENGAIYDYARGTSSFSFEDDIEEFKCKKGSAVSGGDLLSREKAIEIAKEKCTVGYNATDVFFDDEENIWKIVFYTDNTAGGCQTVYLNSDGTVRLIVYGE